MLKSSLKSTSKSLGCRQVTFSKTVEIYRYPSDCRIDDDDDNNENFESADCIDECIIEHREIEDAATLEKPEDFRVHKVVYSTFEELFPGQFANDTGTDEELFVENFTYDSDTSEKYPDSCAHDAGTDSDECEPIIYYPSESESEVQEFVVHCVNQLEKQKCPQSLISKKVLDSEGKVCTLSIENIEQHNKLTESEIHIDTNLESTGGLFNTTVTLSPPLQDFGIEHLICPQSDKWFWELDISPLNSTLESDSASVLSSEDTMIMMTTEECEKNEKRIQESLQRFESLKRLKSSTQENPHEEGESKSDSTTTAAMSGAAVADGVDLSLDSLKIAENLSESKLLTKNSLISCENKQLPQVLCDENFKESVVAIEKCESTDLPSSQSSVLLDNPLASIQIPRDVREWKIEVKESRLSGDGGGFEEFSSLEPSNQKSSVHVDDGASMSLPDYTSDELESFVNECTERIERIKKRYSISEKPLWTPRRGIRPRFGSTAQILQQMQSSGYSSVPNPHYSWPCYSSADSETECSYSLISHSELLPTNLCDLHACGCSETAASDASISYAERWSPVSFKCDLKRDEAVISPVLSERGVPEGSSPPPTSVESVLETKNQNEPCSLSSDGVIYYSLKV